MSKTETNSSVSKGQIDSRFGASTAHGRHWFLGEADMESNGTFHHAAKSFGEVIMEHLQDMRLEMSLLLPAAILFQPGRNQEVGESPNLKVERQRRSLCLIPMGSWDAEMLLEGLAKVFAVPDRSERLKLNLDKLGRFDDLALSALIVVLRKYAERFRSILLCGLPLWASSRIQQTGAENLFGSGWTAELSPDAARFHRCN